MGMRIWLVASGLQLRELGPGPSWGGESDGRGERGTAFPENVLRKTGEEDTGLGQREFLCTRNHWKTLILSPNKSLLGFRGDSCPENLKWGRGKPS